LAKEKGREREGKRKRERGRKRGIVKVSSWKKESFILFINIYYIPS
jgi:hypothetical protein